MDYQLLSAGAPPASADTAGQPGRVSPLRWRRARLAASTLLAAASALISLGLPATAFAQAAGSGATLGDVAHAVVVDASDWPASAASVQPFEDALLELTNAERTRHGLQPLLLDAGLLEVARIRAAAQVGQTTLAHFNVAGELAFETLIEERGLAYAMIAENLVRVSGPESSAAARATQGVINSPAHLANILEPSFDRVAVAGVRDPSGRIIFAQIFWATS